MCSIFFFLFKLCRKAQSDLPTNQISSQGADEGTYNAPVLAKQQSYDSRKHLGLRLNNKKSVKSIPENPYCSPGALLRATGKESCNMIEQI